MAQNEILIIDNNSQTLFTASRALEKNQYKVQMALNGGSGIEFLKGGNFALVLAELALGDVPVLSVIKTVRSMNPETRVIIQSEDSEEMLRKNIFKLGADDYIFKPYQDEELLFRIKKNIEHYELKQKISHRKNFFSSCCVCKRIRIDDNGPRNDRWREVEDFLKEEMDVLLSSTYCPKCAQSVQEDLLVQIDRLKALKVCR